METLQLLSVPATLYVLVPQPFLTCMLPNKGAIIELYKPCSLQVDQGLS